MKQKKFQAHVFLASATNVGVTEAVAEMISMGVNHVILVNATWEDDKWFTRRLAPAVKVSECYHVDPSAVDERQRIANSARAKASKKAKTGVLVVVAKKDEEHCSKEAFHRRQFLNTNANVGK